MHFHIQHSRVDLPISSSAIPTDLYSTNPRSKLPYTFPASQVFCRPPKCLCQVTIAGIRQSYLKLHPSINDIVGWVQLSPSFRISRVFCQVLSIRIEILVFNSYYLTGIEQFFCPRFGCSSQAWGVYQWDISQIVSLMPVFPAHIV